MRIGVDVGGTKTHAVAFGDDDRVLAEDVRPSGRGDDVTLAVRRAVQHLQRVAGPSSSLGIGVPGVVDARTGTVVHAVNLGVEHLELATGVADLVDGPVRVDNDMSAAALGAFHVLGRPPSLAYLNVGTGLAAGIVLDGRLWRGHGGVAGEVGHLPLDGSGTTCACGQRGCLETVASGGAVDRAWGGSPPFGEALAGGDARARAIHGRLVDGVADAVQVLVLTVGVAEVALGGGVVRHLGSLLDDLRTELAARAARSAFLASLDLTARLRPVPDDVPFPALGAALLPSTTAS